MDMLLAPDGDILYDNSGPTVTQDIAEAVGQKLQIKFNTFLGEWFLNTEVGIPYFQKILGHSTSKAAVDIIFREKILEEEDVLDIVLFESTLNARVYSMSFSVRARNGEVAGPIEISIGA